MEKTPSSLAVALSEFNSRWDSDRLAALFSENKTLNTECKIRHALQFKFGTIMPKPETKVDDSLLKTWEKYTIVHPDDIMINGLNLNYDFVSFRIGLVKEDGIITSAYISLRPREGVNSKFYNYYFKALDARKVFHGLGTGIRRTLSYRELKNVILPIPTNEEQSRIVRYLDWKTSTVNRLINIKRKEIKTIDEMKHSMISSTVTCGLNQNAHMKFSGVKWVGDIPEHWKTIKLRQILRAVSKKNRPELPLLSVVRELGVIVRDVEDQSSNRNFIPDDLSGYKVVRKGQFAMNKMKAWQGSYGISDYTGIVSPAYFVFDVSFDNLEYFHYAIRSKVYVNFFAQASDGIRVGQWDLRMDKMKEIPFIIPPADEQVAIVEYINKTLPRYDAAIEKLTAAVETLEEYKTKLISDVVTGKIDVRNITVPEYEYVEDTNNDGHEEKSEAKEGLYGEEE